MVEVYNRKYSLEIGRSPELIKRTIPSTIIKAGGVESTPSPAGGGYTDSKGTYHDFLVRPNGAIKLTDLRITADITYTKEGKGNKQGAVITIYNLSKTNQNRIRAEDTVLLRAGYDKDGLDTPLIFVGQVKYMSTERKSVDYITKLVCTEAEVPRKNVTISKIPLRNETSGSIALWFAEIAAANGIPIGNVKVLNPVAYPSGFPIAGNYFNKLEEFCTNTDLLYYMSLGRLHIESRNYYDEFKIIKVEPDVVIGSIEREDDATGETSEDPDRKEGIKFTLFLDGNITLDYAVEVTYGEYKGRYGVTSVQHRLDLEGTQWVTVVTCKRG